MLIQNIFHHFNDRLKLVMIIIIIIMTINLLISVPLVLSLHQKRTENIIMLRIRTSGKNYSPT
jgi:hypothetical protein